MRFFNVHDDAAHDQESGLLETHKQHPAHGLQRPKQREHPEGDQSEGQDQAAAEGSLAVDGRKGTSLA